MQIEDKLIVFDLDDTILKTNTFHRFIIYEFKNNNWYGKLRIFYTMLLRKLRFISSLELKNRILKRHKGKSKKELEAYFFGFYKSLIKYYDNGIVRIIQRFLEKGYEVIVITGAFFEYSVHIAHSLGINKIIATQFGYTDDIFTGYVDGREMLAEEKKRYIVNSKYKNRKIIFFSDSYLDKPLLDYSYKAYLVSLNKPTHKIRYYRKNA